MSAANGRRSYLGRRPFLLAMFPSVSPLSVVPLRDAFPHEAHAFTKWLADHLDALGDRLGLSLTLVQREKDVGSFWLDLLCEDEAGRPVIVENQLEPTDHRHLGQLLTYLVNLEARTAIWVTSDPRPEHLRVVDWLNEVTPEDVSFFLVRVEAIRIGDSPYAPLFTKIVGPDAQGKQIGEQKKELAERHHRRHEFWTRLLARAAARGHFAKKYKPSKEHWLTVYRVRGFEFNLYVTQKGAAIDLYIDRDTQAVNKALYDQIATHSEAIEADFGGRLEWKRLDDKRASRVVWSTNAGSLQAPESWDALQDTLLDQLDRFIAAVEPHLPASLPTPQG